jgi:hypothetical protein
MSDVLVRLLGRATGEAQAGLRPRVPTLFERGFAETGFLESAAVVLADRPPPEPAVEATAAPARQRDRAPDATESPLPEVPPREPPADAALLRPARAAPRVPESASGRQAAPEAAPDARPPVPLIAEVPTRPAPVLPVPPPAATDGAAEPGSDTHAPGPPAQLLPAEPAKRVHERVVERMTGTRAGAQPAAAVQPSAPAAEPEISIHIGRLDIRADAPEPAPRRGPPPTRSLLSLSDYLRGGRK